MLKVIMRLRRHRTQLFTRLRKEKVFILIPLRIVFTHRNSPGRRGSNK